MADELSLVIENPHEGEFLKRIDWNKTEFMELVTSITEQYEGLTYTEDQVKEAKADRAKLNAMKKAISDRRIQVKKAVMEPYTKFEAEVAEVTALIDKPISIIDTQIREYEDRTREEKRESLKEYFQEEASELEGILTFDMVFDRRYLNTTVSLNKAKEDISGKIERIRIDLRSLEEFCGEKYLTIAKDRYLRTLNVSDALAEAKRLAEFDRMAEEERLRREAETARIVIEAETTETVESAQKPIENATAQAEAAPYIMPSGISIDTPDTFPGVKKTVEEDAKPCKASFTVYGTRAQIMALKEYMIKQNIKFGKVER